MIPEDWDAVSLSTLFTFKNGLNKAKRFFGHGTPIVNYMDVYRFPALRMEMVVGRVDVSKTELENYNVRRGDVFFTRTSETVEEVGIASAMLDEANDTVFSGFVLRARPKNVDLVDQFKAYAFRSDTVRNQIVAKATYTTRALTNGGALSAIILAKPPKPEQTAIAEALSDMDAAIAAVEAVIAKKRALKTATMQALLSGTRRLPGFGDPSRSTKSKQTEVGLIPEDWEVSTVGKEFHIQLGKMLDAERNRGQPKPYVGNRAVRWGRIEADELGTVPMSPSDLSRYRLQRGDILVCEGGEVGRSAIWKDELVECYYQKALHRLRVKGKYNPAFLTDILYHASITGGFENFVTQTSIAHLTKEKLETFPILKPNEIEQAAIAEALSDMNDGIAMDEARLAKLRRLKTGMMQQLLTGKIRLV
jgi:type I restriction enzyme S subunit